MESDKLVIKELDAESIKDPNLVDETKVYEHPGYLFVSSGHVGEVEKWWTKTAELSTVEIGDPHPNATLAAAGWKFKNSIEYHWMIHTFGWSIPAANAAGNYKAWPMADVNSGDMQTLQAVDNVKCSTIDDKSGILRMWAMKGPVNTTGIPAASRDYGAAALMTAKGPNKFAPHFVRINPGMRIELRVKVNGVRTGFVPTIELRNPNAGSYTSQQNLIDILRNTNGNVVNQRVISNTENASTLKTITKIGEWNIYWVELDKDEIRLGINGSTTVSAAKTDEWAFDYGVNGLCLVIYLGPGDRTVAGWDTELKSISDPKNDAKSPMMEIDWIRFYTNKDNETLEATLDQSTIWTSPLYY